jgi:hypothetical protein
MHLRLAHEASGAATKDRRRPGRVKSGCAPWLLLLLLFALLFCLCLSADYLLLHTQAWVGLLSEACSCEAASLGLKDGAAGIKHSRRHIGGVGKNATHDRDCNASDARVTAELLDLAR